MYLRRHGVSGVIQDIAAAITRQENVNPSYNNPGALIAAPGCTSVPGSIARCPTPEIGQADLERQIQLYANRGFSISDMISKWAPKCSAAICAGNDPGTYAANVGQWTGLDTSVPISLLGAQSSSDASSGPVVDFSSVNLSSDLFSSLDPLTVGIAAGVVVLALVIARS